MIEAIVRLSKDDTGVWIHVKAPSGAIGVFNVCAMNSPLARYAFVEWAQAYFKYTPLACGHPSVCIGKVSNDSAEEPHCLWCGDITDLETVCNNLALVYDHVTGGKVSKPMTDPDVVIALADDCTNKTVEEYVRDAVALAKQEIKDQVHSLADQIWQGLLDQRQASDALYKIAGVEQG